jgi:Bacterial Ig-like domain (group 2)
MIHKTLLISALMGLAITLTACPTTPAPVLSSVTVTALSGNTLKINEAVQFSAIAKDDTNTVMTGKTFTWLSSDPNVASVDADGKVTAKRFGTVKITASAEGKSGESASQTTYGLEAIGGTRTTLGSTSTQVAFLVRFRKADGSGPVGAGVLTLKGPTGWNNNQPDITNYTGYDKFVWWRSGIGSTNAITGTYSLETTVGGTIFNSSFQIDATKTIESPSSITPSNVTTTSISATWSAITGASSYVLEVWNDTDKKNAFNQWNYVGNTSATVTGGALDLAKTYFVQVHSFSTNLAGGPSSAAFTGTLPEQFNVGFYRVKLGAFASAGVLTRIIPPNTSDAPKLIVSNEQGLVIEGFANSPAKDVLVPTQAVFSNSVTNEKVRVFFDEAGIIERVQDENDGTFSIFRTVSENRHDCLVYGASGDYLGGLAILTIGKDSYQFAGIKPDGQLTSPQDVPSNIVTLANRFAGSQAKQRTSLGNNVDMALDITYSFVAGSIASYLLVATGTAAEVAGLVGVTAVTAGLAGGIIVGAALYAGIPSAWSEPFSSSLNSLSEALKNGLSTKESLLNALDRLGDQGTLLKDYAQRNYDSLKDVLSEIKDRLQQIKQKILPPPPMSNFLISLVGPSSALVGQSVALSGMISGIGQAPFQFDLAVDGSTAYSDTISGAQRKLTFPSGFTCPAQACTSKTFTFTLTVTDASGRSVNASHSIYVPPFP